MRALQASTSSSCGVGISSFAAAAPRRLRLRHHHVILAKVEPSDKSVEIMRKFSEQYAHKSGTYFCVDKGVTSVVIKKVVKTQQTGSGGSRTDYQSLSGGKRSASQRFRSNTGGSLLASNKRLRGDFGACSPDYNRVHDARVGRNDLRLKLMRKERLKRIQSEVEARKKMYLHEKMSIWSTDRRQLRHTSPIKRSGEMLQAESLRKPYPSYNGDPLKPRFPERVLKVSRETSPPRHIDELQRFPSRRPSDTSRNGQHLDYVLYPSRIIGPASVTMGATHDAGKPVTGPPPASALPNASYTGEQPLTVSGLLHSLGLGKYAIWFQAEEVDMAALKQMGDKDLKELGIPMGPRKKILLALLPRSKQQKW